DQHMTTCANSLLMEAGRGRFAERRALARAHAHRTPYVVATGACGAAASSACWRSAIAACFACFPVAMSEIMDDGVLAELKRLVPLLALRAHELDHLDPERRASHAEHIHRPEIDQLSVAFEPKALGLSIRIFLLLLAVAQLAPDALKSLPHVGFHARRVIERRIENRSHLLLLWHLPIRRRDVAMLAIRFIQACGNE